MKFDKIVVLGMGKLAFQCGEYTARFTSAEVRLCDVNERSSPYLENACSRSEVVYEHLGKQILFEKLQQEETNILLISAYNPWIIPASVLDKSNLEAINLHHALLPKHPGRYGEAWAIFEGDAKAGITWHMLTAKVDAGDLIIQKECPIQEHTTSILLLQQMNKLAYQAFTEIIVPLLKGKVRAVKQPAGQKGTFHFSQNKPNHGFLDKDWDTRKISAFLRAWDYGVTSPFGRPQVELEGRYYTWQRYRIEKAAEEHTDDAEQEEYTEYAERKEYMENKEPVFRIDGNTMIFSDQYFKITLSGLKLLENTSD